MGDERAREGLEHLQAAFLELIAAARAFLDVAEDVVRDPDLAARLTRLGDVLRQPGRRPAGADGEDGGVERIRVD